MTKTGFQKTVALFLLLTNFSSELSYVQAAPSETLTSPAASLDRVLRDPSLFEAPLDVSSLKEIHRGAREALVFHVEDAHSNLSGQRNLAATIDRIGRKYGVDLVLVEGGSSPDGSLGPLKKLASPAAVRRAAESLLVEGRISGEEYLSLVSDRPIKVRGVEDMKLYRESVEAYARLAARRAAALEYLGEIRAALARLKSKLYPPDLLEYEKKKDGDGRTSLLWKLVRRYGVDLKDLPAGAKLSALHEKEERIDFDVANLEQAEVIRELAARGGAEAVRGVLESARGPREARWAAFHAISELAAKKGVDLSRYPNLRLYGEYLKDFSETDLDRLIGDIETAEDRVYSRAFSGEGAGDSRLVRSMDRYLGLLDAAFRVRMSSAEFMLFEANEKDFATEACLAFVNRKLADLGFFDGLVVCRPVFDETLPALRDFYGSVSRRDEAFAANMKKILAEEGRKAAILVTGGYHSRHLKEIFRREDYSYLTIAPLVTAETDQKKYENLLFAPFRQKTVVHAAVTAGGGEWKGISKTGNDGVRVLRAVDQNGGHGADLVLRRIGPADRRAVRDLRHEFFRRFVAPSVRAGARLVEEPRALSADREWLAENVARAKGLLKKADFRPEFGDTSSIEAARPHPSLPMELTWLKDRHWGPAALAEIAPFLEANLQSFRQDPQSWLFVVEREAFRRRMLAEDGTPHEAGQLLLAVADRFGIPVENPIQTMDRWPLMRRLFPLMEPLSSLETLGLIVAFMAATVQKRSSAEAAAEVAAEWVAAGGLSLDAIVRSADEALEFILFRQRAADLRQKIQDLYEDPDTSHFHAALRAHPQARHVVVISGKAHEKEVDAFFTYDGARMAVDLKVLAATPADRVRVDHADLPPGIVRDFMAELAARGAGDVILGGGAVRDTLLGRTPKDLDFMVRVELPPALAATFEADRAVMPTREFAKKYRLHYRAMDAMRRAAPRIGFTYSQIRAGKALFQGSKVEFMFSSVVVGDRVIDFSFDGSFTIDGIGMDGSGRIYLTHGSRALEDLRDGLIRLEPKRGEKGPINHVGTKNALRAYRFRQQYGFRIDPSFEKLIRDSIARAASASKDQDASFFGRIRLQIKWLWRDFRNLFRYNPAAFMKSQRGHFWWRVRHVLFNDRSFALKGYEVWLAAAIAAVPDRAALKADLDQSGILGLMRRHGLDVDRILDGARLADEDYEVNSVRLQEGPRKKRMVVVGYLSPNEQAELAATMGINPFDVEVVNNPGLGSIVAERGNYDVVVIDGSPLYKNYGAAHKSVLDGDEYAAKLRRNFFRGPVIYRMHGADELERIGRPGIVREVPDGDGRSHLELTERGASSLGTNTIVLSANAYGLTRDLSEAASGRNVAALLRRLNAGEKISAADTSSVPAFRHLAPQPGTAPSKEKILEAIVPDKSGADPAQAQRLAEALWDGAQYVDMQTMAAILALNEDARRAASHDLSWHSASWTVQPVTLDGLSAKTGLPVEWIRAHVNPAIFTFTRDGYAVFSIDVRSPKIYQGGSLYPDGADNLQFFTFSHISPFSWALVTKMRRHNAVYEVDFNRVRELGFEFGPDSQWTAAMAVKSYAFGKSGAQHPAGIPAELVDTDRLKGGEKIRIGSGLYEIVDGGSALRGQSGSVYSVRPGKGIEIRTLDGGQRIALKPAGYRAQGYPDVSGRVLLAPLLPEEGVVDRVVPVLPDTTYDDSADLYYGKMPPVVLRHAFWMFLSRSSRPENADTPASVDFTVSVKPFMDQVLQEHSRRRRELAEQEAQAERDMDDLLGARLAGKSRAEIESILNTRPAAMLAVIDSIEAGRPGREVLLTEVARGLTGANAVAYTDLHKWMNRYGRDARVAPVVARLEATKVENRIRVILARSRPGQWNDRFLIYHLGVEGQYFASWKSQNGFDLDAFVSSRPITDQDREAVRGLAPLEDPPADFAPYSGSVEKRKKGSVPKPVRSRPFVPAPGSSAGTVAARQESDAAAIERWENEGGAVVPEEEAPVREASPAVYRADAPTPPLNEYLAGLRDRIRGHIAAYHEIRYKDAGNHEALVSELREAARLLRTDRSGRTEIRGLALEIVRGAIQLSYDLLNAHDMALSVDSIEIARSIASDFSDAAPGMAAAAADVVRVMVFRARTHQEDGRIADAIRATEEAEQFLSRSPYAPIRSFRESATAVIARYNLLANGHFASAGSIDELIRAERLLYLGHRLFERYQDVAAVRHAARHLIYRLATLSTAYRRRGHLRESENALGRINVVLGILRDHDERAFAGNMRRVILRWNMLAWDYLRRGGWIRTDEDAIDDAERAVRNSVRLFREYSAVDAEVIAEGDFIVSAVNGVLIAIRNEDRWRHQDMGVALARDTLESIVEQAPVGYFRTRTYDVFQGLLVDFESEDSRGEADGARLASVSGPQFELVWGPRQQPVGGHYPGMRLRSFGERRLGDAAQALTMQEAFETAMAYLRGDGHDFGPLLFNVNRTLQNPEANPRRPSRSAVALSDIRHVRLWVLKEGSFTAVFQVEARFTDGKTVRFVLNVAKDRTDAAQAVRFVFPRMTALYGADPASTAEFFDLGDAGGVPVFTGEWIENSDEIHLYPAEAPILHVWEGQDSGRPRSLGFADSVAIWGQILRFEIVHHLRLMLSAGDYVVYRDAQGPHVVTIWMPPTGFRLLSFAAPSFESAAASFMRAEWAGNAYGYLDRPDIVLEALERRYAGAKGELQVLLERTLVDLRGAIADPSDFGRALEPTEVPRFLEVARHAVETIEQYLAGLKKSGAGDGARLSFLDTGDWGAVRFLEMNPLLDRLSREDAELVRRILTEDLGNDSNRLLRLIDETGRRVYLSLKDGIALKREGRTVYLDLDAESRRNTGKRTLQLKGVRPRTNELGEAAPYTAGMGHVSRPLAIGLAAELEVDGVAEPSPLGGSVLSRSRIEYEIPRTTPPGAAYETAVPMALGIWRNKFYRGENLAFTIMALDAPDSRLQIMKDDEDGKYRLADVELSSDRRTPYETVTDEQIYEAIGEALADYNRTYVHRYPHMFNITVKVDRARKIHVILHDFDTTVRLDSIRGETASDTDRLVASYRFLDVSRLVYDLHLPRTVWSGVDDMAQPHRVDGRHLIGPFFRGYFKRLDPSGEIAREAAETAGREVFWTRLSQLVGTTPAEKLIQYPPIDRLDLESDPAVGGVWKAIHHLSAARLAADPNLAAWTSRLDALLAEAPVDDPRYRELFDTIAGSPALSRMPGVAFDITHEYLGSFTPEVPVTARTVLMLLALYVLDRSRDGDRFSDEDLTRLAHSTQLYSYRPEVRLRFGLAYLFNLSLSPFFRDHALFESLSRQIRFLPGPLGVRAVSLGLVWSSVHRRGTARDRTEDFRVNAAEMRWLFARAGLLSGKEREAVRVAAGAIASYMATYLAGDPQYLGGQRIAEQKIVGFDRALTDELFGVLRDYAPVVDEAIAYYPAPPTPADRGEYALVSDLRREDPFLMGLTWLLYFSAESHLFDPSVLESLGPVPVLAEDLFLDRENPDAADYMRRVINVHMRHFLAARPDTRSFYQAGATYHPADARERRWTFEEAWAYVKTGEGARLADAVKPFSILAANDARAFPRAAAPSAAEIDALADLLALSAEQNSGFFTLGVTETRYAEIEFAAAPDGGRSIRVLAPRSFSGAREVLFERTVTRAMLREAHARFDAAHEKTAAVQSPDDRTIAGLRRDEKAVDGVTRVLLARTAAALTSDKHVLLSIAISDPSDARLVSETAERVREMRAEIEAVSNQTARVHVYFAFTDRRGKSVEAEGLRADAVPSGLGPGLEKIYTGVLDDALVRSAFDAGAGFLGTEEERSGDSYRVIPRKAELRAAVMAAVAGEGDEHVRQAIHTLTRAQVGPAELRIVRRVPQGATAETYLQKNLYVKALATISRDLYERWLALKYTGLSA